MINLDNPDQIDLAIGKVFMALNIALKSKSQLLPYLRDKILDETQENFTTLSDDDVRDWLKTLKVAE